jgi:REP element-mobilizing transposase RayT
MTIVGWIDLFTRERYCEAVTDSFKFCIQHKGLRLFEYIIMPSHVHLIARHLEGGLHAVIRDMKSYLAKEFRRLPDTPGESRKEWLKYMFAYYAKDINQDNEVKPGISNEQVAVIATCDRSGHKDFKVATQGRVSKKDIEKVLKGKLDKAEVLCSDSHRSYTHSLC